MWRIDFNICKFNMALFLRAMLLLTPVMLLFYQENGLTVKELFFFQGIFYLVCIMSEGVVGYLSDTFSRKNLLILSFVIFLGIYLLWLFCHGYYVILVGEIFFALSKTIMDNAMSGYLYDYLSCKNRKSEMVKHYGYLNFYLSLGTALGGLIGTYIYSVFGSRTILISEILLIFVTILLVLSLHTVSYTKSVTENIFEKVRKFINITKEIYGNTSIKYYIFYSGLLTSFSILFALSFQPLMQNAFVPIALFGIVVFINHGVRALAGVFSGKWLQNFEIRKLVFPLYCLYILAFSAIFLTLNTKNTFIVLFLLTIICLIIGVQLVFTILHVSRLHRLVDNHSRGSVMAVNNFVLRSMTVIILISSKLFIGKLDLFNFFIIAFVIFLVFGAVLVLKIFGRKDLL